MIQQKLFMLTSLPGNRTSVIVDISKAELFFDLFHSNNFNHIGQTEAIGINHKPDEMEIIVNAPLDEVSAVIKEHWK